MIVARASDERGRAQAAARRRRPRRPAVRGRRHRDGEARAEAAGGGVPRDRLVARRPRPALRGDRGPRASTRRPAARSASCAIRSDDRRGDRRAAQARTARFDTTPSPDVRARGRRRPDRDRHRAGAARARGPVRAARSALAPRRASTASRRRSASSRAARSSSSGRRTRAHGDYATNVALQSAQAARPAAARARGGARGEGRRAARGRARRGRGARLPQPLGHRRVLRRGARRDRRRTTAAAGPSTPRADPGRDGLGEPDRADHGRLGAERRLRRQRRAAARVRRPRRSSASTTTTTPARRWSASAPRSRRCGAARSRPRTATRASTSPSSRASRATRCRAMLERIEATLERFRIHFDSWAKQSELERELAATPRAAPDRTRRTGALYVRSTEFGDDKDRRARSARPRRAACRPTRPRTSRTCATSSSAASTARSTCSAPTTTASRGWYAVVARMLGYDPARVEVLLYQLVHLTRGGEQTKMSKRKRRRRLPRRLHRRGRRRRRALVPRQPRPRPDDRDRRRPRGREDAEEPGLLRPVRARADRGHPPQRARRAPSDAPSPGMPLEPQERELVKRLAEFPASSREATERRGPQVIPVYAIRLADDFHRFYHDVRVLGSEAPRRSGSRSCRATQRRDRALPRPRRGRGARADVGDARRFPRDASRPLTRLRGRCASECSPGAATAPA